MKGQTDPFNLAAEVAAINNAAARVLSFAQTDVRTAAHGVSKAELGRVAGALQAAGAQLRALAAQIDSSRSA